MGFGDETRGLDGWVLADNKWEGATGAANFARVVLLLLCQAARSKRVGGMSFSWKHMKRENRIGKHSDFYRLRSETCCNIYARLPFDFYEHSYESELLQSTCAEDIDFNDLTSWAAFLVLLVDLISIEVEMVFAV